MKISRWVTAITLSVGLLGAPSAFARGGHHHSLHALNSNSKIHHRPRTGAKQPKALGTQKRTGNKSGNAETAEHDRHIEDAPSGESN